MDREEGVIWIRKERKKERKKDKRERDEKSDLESSKVRVGERRMEGITQREIERETAVRFLARFLSLSFLSLFLSFSCISKEWMIQSIN